MNRIGLGAALALLLGVNALVLLGVARNRSGEPLSSLELTERELRLSWSREEDTGLSLGLDWTLAGDWLDAAGWFGRARLEEIGFDCSLPVDAPGAPERYGNVLPRETFAVFEMDGAAWQEWLLHEEEELETLRGDLDAGDATREQVDRAERSLKWARITHSRLFVIDVGKDPERLRTEYPDRARTMILPVLVRLRTDLDMVDDEPVLKGLYGDVADVLVDPIHVPLSHRSVLDALPADEDAPVRFRRRPPAVAGDEDTPPAPRFTVLLHVGRRHEPWVGAVRTYEPPAAGDTVPDVGP